MVVPAKLQVRPDHGEVAGEDIARAVFVNAVAQPQRLGRLHRGGREGRVDLEVVLFQRVEEMLLLHVGTTRTTRTTQHTRDV